MLCGVGVLPAVTGPVTTMEGVASTAVVVWLVTVSTTVTSCPAVAWRGVTMVLAVRKVPRLTSTSLVFTCGAATGSPVSAALPPAARTKTPPPAAVAV